MSTVELSALANSVAPSATLAAAAKARELRGQGVKVYDFSVGEPDFNTPDHICEAAIQAMKEGHTGYTPAPGTLELRQAISRWYKSRYDIDYAPDQIIVSNGAKHSIHNALSVLCGPGDEVLIPSPYWVSYSELVKMTGATYKLIPTTMESNFTMTPEQLKDAISPNSKVIMLNSPSNPTGAVYRRDQLEAIADIVMEAGLIVLSDEIYEQLIYVDIEPTCFATLRPGLEERTLTISGASKSYAMTGWRIGWTLGPKSVIKAMGSIQSQQTGCPGSIAQHAVITALEGDQSCVQKMKTEFAKRRTLVHDRLNKMPGINCPFPQGAFYAFFDMSAWVGKQLGGKTIDNSTTFCETALESIHVNMVTGEAFGVEGFVRLSYAASLEEINEGLDRLESWLKEAE